MEKHLSPKRFQSVQRKVGKNAGRAVAVASLAPPPFPFTAVIMAASGLQYSRQRLLTIVGVCRAARFVIVGALALRFGKSILGWAKNPLLQWILIGLIVVCTVGSVISVYGWLKRRRPLIRAATVRERPAVPGYQQPLEREHRGVFVRGAYISRIFRSLPNGRGSDRGYPAKAFLIGSSRMRLPVAAKIAAVIAGAITGAPGSPTPACGAFESTIVTSIFRGACFKRATG